MEAVNSNQHRFYFDVVAKKSGNVIASDVPSYKVACRYIRQYALKTGDSEERYDIMLYRRKNHRRWSVLQCGTRFRDDQVLIVNAHYIEGRSVMIKCLRYGAEARASLKRAMKLRDVDPKPGDLSMGRLK